MRAHLSLPTAVLALTVALLSTGRSAEAQAAQHAVPRADVAAAVPVIRPLAVYRIGPSRPALTDLPVRVTVADSSGTLVARYRADRTGDERAMAVTVMHTDLVLQAETPSGLLTLLLERQNDTPDGAFSGRWWLGADGGVLRARSAR